MISGGHFTNCAHRSSWIFLKVLSSNGELLLKSFDQSVMIFFFVPLLLSPFVRFLLDSELLITVQPQDSIIQSHRIGCL